MLEYMNFLWLNTNTPIQFTQFGIALNWNQFEFAKFGNFFRLNFGWMYHHQTLHYSTNGRQSHDIFNSFDSESELELDSQLVSWSIDLDCSVLFDSDKNYNYNNIIHSLASAIPFDILHSVHIKTDHIYYIVVTHNDHHSTIWTLGHGVLSCCVAILLRFLSLLRFNAHTKKS